VSEKKIILSMEEAKKRAGESRLDVSEATYEYNGVFWPYKYRLTVGATQKAAGKMKSSDSRTIGDNFQFVVDLMVHSLTDAPFEISREYIQDELNPEIFEQIADELMGQTKLTGQEKKS